MGEILAVEYHRNHHVVSSSMKSVSNFSCDTLGKFFP